MTRGKQKRKNRLERRECGRTVKTPEKKLVILGLDKCEKNIVKKVLRGKFDVVEPGDILKQNLKNDVKLNRKTLGIGVSFFACSRTDFISKADKVLRSSMQEKYALFNILVRHFDSLILHIGPRLHEEIASFILTKLIEVFGEDIADRRKVLIGVISERKYMVLSKIFRPQDGETATDEYIEKIAKLIIEKITSDKLRSDHKDIHISVNIGVGLYPKDGETIAEIIKASEISLEESIKKGANIYEVLSDELKVLVWKKSLLVNELFEALKQGKIYPVFQPIFSLEDMRVKGYEMLLRWKEFEINPKDVIEIGEEFGLIGEINEFLFVRLAEMSERLPKYFFSFNISPRFILTDKFFNMILESVKKYRIEPARICFEISERSEQKEIEKARDKFFALKSYGFLIALDDFGSPSTTISHIKDIPADIVKVDRDVIKGVGERNEFFELIGERVISILHRFGRKLVIEGVENETEIQIAKRMKFDMAQGFAFSPPLHEDEIF